MSIRIRPGEYRGKSGFHVTGKVDPKSGGFPVAIFVESEKAARQCKAAVMAGQEITSDHLLGIDPLWWDTEAS